jgi:ribonuclease HI
MIHIYTDSEYSIKTVTTWMYQWAKKDWKTATGQQVKNLDIIRDLLFSVISKRKDKIKLTHVRSHTGKNDKLSLGNEMADKLAVKGALKMLE